MYRTDAEMRRAHVAYQREVVDVIVDYRFLAPATLAARARLDAGLARHALLRDGGAPAPAAPGAIRRWLGTQVIRFGVWLGRSAVAINPAPLPGQA